MAADSVVADSHATACVCWASKPAFNLLTDDNFNPS